MFTYVWYTSLAAHMYQDHLLNKKLISLELKSNFIFR